MFLLTPEQDTLRDSVREIVKKHIEPQAAFIDENRAFPVENIKVLAENNLFALYVYKKYGGQGLDSISQMIAIEEVARVCMTTSVFMTNQVLAMSPFIITGNQSQKENFLVKMASGQIMGAMAATERGAGSDVASIQTKAAKYNSHYVINGQKCFIANGGEAGCYVVVAKTNPNWGHRGLSLFIVEEGRKGLLFGKVEKTMGIRGIPIREVIFKNCIIPEANILGEEGQGFITMMKAVDRTRIATAAQAVGNAQGALDYTLQYSRMRTQFRKPIASLQAIQMMLADMATNIEAARMLSYHAASLVDRDDINLVKIASMAKVFASDMGVKVTGDAIQILGGYGYMQDHPLERMSRDAKAIQIYVGTNQINKTMIAGQLFM
ncbi:MAG: acyl-CoA dehydrogenase [Firmicutes bacterium]|nr:acyl-CoA dehydrogenase [Bacillota bacterium]